MNFLRFGEEFFYTVGGHPFRHTVCYSINPTGPASFWACAFALSKVAELGDTFFVVMRKKPLIFLHWYHHAVVLVYSWNSGNQKSTQFFFVPALFFLFFFFVFFFAINILLLKTIAVIVEANSGQLHLSALHEQKKKQLFFKAYLPAYITGKDTLYLWRRRGKKKTLKNNTVINIWLFFFFCFSSLLLVIPKKKNL